MVFAEKVIDFLKNVEYTGSLPENIQIIDSYKENQTALKITEQFYNKFYHDNRKRKLILGINPGRFGAGVTGVPFTDTKRLEEYCHISAEGKHSHEPSSVFMYEMIKSYGGVEKFYGNFYINSISPLGFIKLNEKNNWVNYNYYDSKELFTAVKPFMLESLKKQLFFEIDRDTCYILGKKNFKFIQEINKEKGFFKKLIVLNHPRYIVQYKSSQMNHYIEDYLMKLSIMH